MCDDPQRMNSVSEMKMLLALGLLLVVVSTSQGDAVLSISPHATQIKAVGSKMIFTCTVNTEHNMQDNVPTIRWIGPDRKVIPDSKGRAFVEQLDKIRLRLYITDIANTDSGLYTCECDINGTTISAQTSLDIYEDIEFNSKSTNITYEAGSSALLQCLASGKPEPEISWRFNNNKVLIDGLKYTQEPNGLRIDYVQPDDIGVYECRAEVVSQGNLKVQTVQLDVLYAPVLSHVLVAPVALQDHNVTLKCEGQGNPSVTYQWFKEIQQQDGLTDRQTITSNDKIHVEHGILELTYLELADDGRYVCVISNSLGTFETAADIHVAVAPIVNTVQQTISVLEGNSVEILCEAKGRPLPHVYWIDTNSNRQIVNTESSDGSSLLTVYNISRLQAGTWLCVATNEAGNATQNISIVVEFGPSVTPPVDNMKLGWINQTIVFTCIAAGNPLPDITWLHEDNYDISANKTFKTSITEEKDNTVFSTLQIQIPDRRAPLIYATYTCLAKNNHGFSNATVQLVEAVVADMPRNVTVTKTTSTTLHLSACDPEPKSFSSSLNVTSWIVRYQADTDRLESSKTFIEGDDIVLSNLLPQTMYTVSISAVNPVGVGIPAKVHIKTSPKTAAEIEAEAKASVADDISDMQSDEGRVAIAAASHHESAAAWSLAENSLRDAIDPLPANWSQLSLVLIVGIAVLLATVVVAVSALILHTHRRAVNNPGAQRTGVHTRRDQLNNEVPMTSVKVSDGRDVDNLTLEIKGRRPASPPASIPDQLYRSLGRNAGKNTSVLTEYGSAAPSPRLGARPAPGSANASPALSTRQSAAAAPAAAAAVATVEVSIAQRMAWNQMLEDAERDTATATNGTGLTEEHVSAENQLNAVAGEQIVKDNISEDEDDMEDSKTDSIISEDEYEQRLPPFEAKSFLYPS